MDSPDNQLEKAENRTDSKTRKPDGPPRRRLRTVLLAIWGFLLVGGLYLFLFRPSLVSQSLAQTTSWSFLAGSAVYLAFGCVRGFTLLPSTTLVFAGVAFFPPWPLFAMTLVGIVVSSASIYWFADEVRLAEFLRRRHQPAIDRLTSLLERYELPIIIGWSFFPLVPTDLICYVCGTLRVNFWKCLLGVTIGESAICAAYIFLGDFALRYFQWRT